MIDEDEEDKQYVEQFEDEVVNYESCVVGRDNKIQETITKEGSQYQ